MSGRTAIVIGAITAMVGFWGLGRTIRNVAQPRQLRADLDLNGTATHVALVVRGEAAVRVIDLAAGTIARIPADDDVAHPVLSPDARYLVYEAGPDLVLVDRTAGRRTRIAPGSGFAGAAAFSPDGARLAFRTVVGGGEAVAVVDSGAPARLRLLFRRDGVSVGPLSWSPDSRRLAFLSGADAWIVPASGEGEPVHVLHPRRARPAPESPHGPPSWSSDGRHLAYAAWWDDCPQLVLVDDTTRPGARLPRPGLCAEAPQWLPDAYAVLALRRGAEHSGTLWHVPLWREGRPRPVHATRDRTVSWFAVRSADEILFTAARPGDTRGLWRSRRDAGPDAATLLFAPDHGAVTPSPRGEINR